MPPLPLLKEPLDDGVVALRDFAERDIPEILIAYEDDDNLHERMGLQRPPSGAQLGRRAETEAADRLAGAYATLTVLEAGPRFLGLEEPEAGTALRPHLEADGITLMIGDPCIGVEKASADPSRQRSAVVVHLKSGARVSAERLLVATGRRPRVSASLPARMIPRKPGSPAVTVRKAATLAFEKWWVCVRYRFVSWEDGALNTLARNATAHRARNRPP